jgi:hypothetical protein
MTGAGPGKERLQEAAQRRQSAPISRVGSGSREAAPRHQALSPRRLAVCALVSGEPAAVACALW